MIGHFMLARLKLKPKIFVPVVKVNEPNFCGCLKVLLVVKMSWRHFCYPRIEFFYK